MGELSARNGVPDSANGTSMKCFTATYRSVITGFLFTALPNWTVRLPIQGPRLMNSEAVWLGWSGYS